MLQLATCLKSCGSLAILYYPMVPSLHICEKLQSQATPAGAAPIGWLDSCFRLEDWKSFQPRSATSKSQKQFLLCLLWSQCPTSCAWRLLTSGCQTAGAHARDMHVINVGNPLMGRTWARNQLTSIGAFPSVNCHRAAVECRTRFWEDNCVMAWIQKGFWSVVWNSCNALTSYHDP